jgi:hypothetical protein
VSVRSFVAVVAVVGAAVVLASCGGGDDDTTAPATTTAPRSKGTTTTRITASPPAPTVGEPQGNVNPVLEPVTGLGVAGTAAAVDDRVAVLLQNGGTATARVDVVTATATSRDGASVTRARSVQAFPQVLAPGELSLAAVTFRANGVPPGATVVVKVRGTPVTAVKASRALAVSGIALSAPQTGDVAQTIAATLTNPTGAWTARSPRVAVMCFGESRQPSGITTVRAGVAEIAPGRQASVSVPLATLCPTYLVAASSS